jgi:hypothetical protein
MRLPAGRHYWKPVCAALDILLAEFDFLISDTARDGEGRRDWKDHVAADELAFIFLVETARILAHIAGTDGPAERKIAGAMPTLAWRCGSALS